MSAANDVRSIRPHPPRWAVSRICGFREVSAAVRQRRIVTRRVGDWTRLYPLPREPEPGPEAEPVIDWCLD